MYLSKNPILTEREKLIESFYAIEDGELTKEEAREELSNRI